MRTDELIDLVVEMASEEGMVTNATVRERTGLNRLQALAVLAAANEEGRLERKGEKRGTKYVLPSPEPLDLN
jgi:predicted HTH transcriptional regulator